MKTKHYLFLAIWFIIIIFVISCAPQQQKAPETPSVEKTAPSEIKQAAKDDFGCWPPSCSDIPDPTGKQACEDWKAGKNIMWPPDCGMMQQSSCAKLCEAEKEAGRSASLEQGSTQSQQSSGNEQKQVFNMLPSIVDEEFTSDVTEEDKNFAIQGASTMDFYLQKWFDKSIDKPAELQVSAASNDPNGGARVNTESGTAIILIETGNFGWQRQIQSNKEIGGEWRPRLVAHEYVHAYQFQNGCGRVDAENPVVAKWFIEGQADWLSYKAAIDAGQLPPLTIPQLVTPQAKQVVGSLQSFEKESPNKSPDFAAYFLFNMAIDYLMKDRDIKTLDSFCTNIGEGQTGPEAFQNAFGVSLDKFYEEFEAYRKTW